MRKALSKLNTEEEESNVDLTPVLDVVFIMLIFFIVTASFVKESGIDVNRPDAETAQKKERANILVAIDERNQIWIDRRQVDPRAVRANIERLHAENPQGSVVIQADKNSKNERLVQVMDAARQAGVYNVSIAANDNLGRVEMYTRILFATAPAALVTLALFFLMMSLITTARHKLGDEGERYVVDFVRLKQEEAVKTKERKPEKPPEAEAPPPETAKPQMEAPQINQNVVSIDSAPIDRSLDIATGFGLSGADGDFLPIVKVQPIYPRRALSRGIEGYVIVEFTVTKNGSVKDPVVVEADPPGIFDSAAVKAALKFKYKPLIVDGEPVDVAGVQNKLNFQIAD